MLKNIFFPLIILHKDIFFFFLGIIKYQPTLILFNFIFYFIIIKIFFNRAINFILLLKNKKLFPISFLKLSFLEKFFLVV